MGAMSKQTVIELDIGKVIEQLGLDPSRALEALDGGPADKKKAVLKGA